jgi:hypothetical protein
MKFTPTDEFVIDNSRSKFPSFDPLHLSIISVDQRKHDASYEDLVSALEQESADVMILSGNRSMMNYLRTHLQFNLALLSEDLIVAAKGHILQRDEKSARISLSDDYEVTVITHLDWDLSSSEAVVFVSGDNLPDLPESVIELRSKGEGPSLYGKDLLPVETEAGPPTVAGYHIRAVITAISEQ